MLNVTLASNGLFDDRRHKRVMGCLHSVVHCGAQVWRTETKEPRNKVWRKARHRRIGRVAGPCGRVSFRSASRQLSFAKSAKTLMADWLRDCSVRPRMRRAMLWFLAAWLTLGPLFGIRVSLVTGEALILGIALGTARGALWRGPVYAGRGDDDILRVPSGGIMKDYRAV